MPIAQALNRLKGDFFIFISGFGEIRRKNIKLNSGIFTLLNITQQYNDSHGGEFMKFRENYDFLLLESSEKSKKISLCN